MKQPNSIEAVRLEVGITGPQMLRALGAKEGRGTLLSSEDDGIDPLFLARARTLLAAYRAWAARLKAEAQACNRPLTLTEASTLLGISDFNLAKLAERGLIARTSNGRPRLFLVQAIIDFIDRNSTHLSPGATRSRGPLATPFLNYFLSTEGALGKDESRELAKVS